MPKTLINCPMLVSGCADRDSYDTQLLYLTCPFLLQAGCHNKHPKARN